MTPKKARAISKANAPCLKRVYSQIREAAQTGRCKLEILLEINEAAALALNGYSVKKPPDASCQLSYYEVSWH